jgi:hypothetical protein
MNSGAVPKPEIGSNWFISSDETNGRQPSNWKINFIMKKNSEDHGSQRGYQIEITTQRSYLKDLSLTKTLFNGIFNASTQ